MLLWLDSGKHVNSGLSTGSAAVKTQTQHLVGWWRDWTTSRSWARKTFFPQLQLWLYTFDVMVSSGARPHAWSCFRRT